MIIDFSTMPQEEKLSAAERIKKIYVAAAYEIIVRIGEDPETYDTANLEVPGSVDEKDYFLKRDLQEYVEGISRIDTFITSL
jgi:hypothetical protein